MTTNLPVVLYHYDSSPFATKVKDMLSVKRIPHKRVSVSYILPRPELSQLLGVYYRRIPVLAIGNDVYCDTSLIAAVLERRFPPSQGYGTLFPARKGGGKSDTGLSKALATYYFDRAVFPPATQCLPFSQYPPEFIKDRSAWAGYAIDPDAVAARAPQMKSLLASQLALLQEQLADGREWLMDTETPSLVDIAANFLYAWMGHFKELEELLAAENLAETRQWLARMSEHLNTTHTKGVAPFEVIAGEDAARLIGAAPHEDIAVVGFDVTDAGRLELKHGATVAVVPTDTGKVYTTGTLVALSLEEIVIQTIGVTGVSVHCHFPRLGYAVNIAGAKL